MSRHSSSRQSSFSYAGTPSRRSSVASNPNVFSDDYALEPLDSRLDLSLHDSRHSENLSVGDHDLTRNAPNVTTYPAIPSRLSILNRPSSIAKRPVGNDANSLSHDGTPSRTLSTSSRFSFFRSQSPYSGPTQPSHPYAMYPQVTRASSIASESTIRPHENPFVPTGGPEHPYSLYPQNTVLEDEDGDEDIGTQPIPLGFPRLGFSNSRTTGRPGSDVGDIIGSDGHIEQLPPYTRYADNIIAKGDMADINDASTVAMSRRASQRSTLVPSMSPTSQRTEGNEREHEEREILLSEEPKKETWQEKAHKKVCGGVSLWVLVLIIVAVVFAGVVGGVIGGVVGRRQGSESVPTATVFIDADPASTGKHTPPCPTGRYSIPLNQTQDINNCVVTPGQGQTWDCLEIAYLGITISEAVEDNDKKLQVTFDDYSVDPSTFRYGPQPPDFNGTSFDLTPAKDRDNYNLGVAMFFYQEFDKLVILPDWVFSGASPQGRSVAERYVLERGQQSNGHLISVGDAPWFCFWNATINEFWIFLEKPSVPTSLYTGPMPTPTPDTQSSGTYFPTQATTAEHSVTGTMWNTVSMAPTPTLKKRDAYTSPYLPQYPQLVKMIEKRQPDNNVVPYCQHMKVLSDWQVVPKNDEVILIQESQYDITPVVAGVGDARLARRDTDESITQQLESNCVCEWISI